MADESVMIELLGVAQGCATPLALFNDTNKKVNLIIDSALVANNDTLIWSHPLVNDHSIGLTSADLKKFLNALDRLDGIVEVNFESLT